MKFTKKNVLIVALAVCLLAVISMGTLAWFTDSDEVTNDFYFANSEDDADKIFSVNVWEKDAEGKIYDDKKGIQFDDVLPNDNLYKEANIENTGYYDQYIRATVTVSGASIWQKLFGEVYVPLNKIATDLNAAFVVDRTVYNADDDTLTYVLYYNQILSAEDAKQVVNLFTNVYIAKEMTREDAAALSGEFYINVIADAVQTENVGDGAIAAFTTIGKYEDAGKFTVVKTGKGLETILNNTTVWNRATLNSELELGVADFDAVYNKPTDSVVFDLADGNIALDKINFIRNDGAMVINAGSIAAGTASDYCLTTVGAKATTVLNNVNVVSAGGGVAAADGAKVTFKGGSLEINTTSTSGRYLFYTEGAGSEIVIEDGVFNFNKTQNQKRAYVYAGAGSTVIIKDGTFGTASSRAGYTAGIMGEGTVIIYGGTFGFNPSNWVAEGYEAVQTGSTWTVQAKA